MKKTTFIIWWVLVFAASYTALSFLGMIPVELSEAHYRLIESVKSVFRTNQTEADVSTATSTSSPAVIEKVNEIILPSRIAIPKIGVDTPVVNPETRDTGVLDRALLEGVVRYHGSGGLDDESNMFLFGHSTGYSTVRNQAFKAFNRLGELQIGDMISVDSGDMEYRYKVSSISHVDSDQALVELKTGKKMLTLSTCDSFGEKNDRFVVQAEFLQALPLPSAAN